MSSKPSGTRMVRDTTKQTDAEKKKEEEKRKAEAKKNGPPQSSMPGTRMNRDVPSSQSSKPGTKMNRDTRAPQSSQAAPTRLNRDQIEGDKSARPSTALQRDDSAAKSSSPGSKMNKTQTSTAKSSPVEQPTSKLKSFFSRKPQISEAPKTNVATSIQRDASRTASSSRAGSQVDRDIPRSVAPGTMKTIFKTNKDYEMASKQTRYETLAPEEKKQQDKWLKEAVFAKLKDHCPSKYEFRRIPDQPGRPSAGFQCKGGNHIVLDWQIEEGLGGLWLAPLDIRKTGNPFGIKGKSNADSISTSYLFGPYYPGREGYNGKPAWFFCGGPEDIMMYSQVMNHGFQPIFPDPSSGSVPPRKGPGSTDHILAALTKFRRENGLEELHGLVESRGPGTDFH